MYAVAFALRLCKMVRSLKQELSEAERYAVADDVIWQLKKHGDPWRLNEAEGERADDLSRLSRRCDVPLPCAMRIPYFDHKGSVERQTPPPERPRRPARSPTDDFARAAPSHLPGSGFFSWRQIPFRTVSR